MSDQRIFKKAMAAYERQHFGSARKMFEKLLRDEPNHLDARYLLGTLYAQQGQRQKAFHHLTIAAQLDSDSPMIKTNLGILHQQEGNLILAEKYFLSAIRIDETLYQAHFNLAVILQTQDRFPEAVVALNNTLRFAPDFFPAHLLLGKTYQKTGNTLLGEQSVKKALELQPGNLEALHLLANLLSKAGKLPEARRTYQRILEIQPADVSASYVISILDGETPDAPPRGHVQAIFNELAESFEQHLGSLGYQGPDQLLNLLQDNIDGEMSFNCMLDIGCGTGAAGRVFRNVVNHQIGIDIAEHMVEKSRQTGVYDELRVAEPGDLKDDDGKYDLVVAADVFPYFGDLDLIMPVLHRLMENDAYLLFTTEVFTTEGHSGDGDFRVNRSTGRYQYSDPYLHSIAGRHGFRIVHMKMANLRQESGLWLQGHYCVWQKHSDDLDSFMDRRKLHSTPATQESIHY